MDFQDDEDPESDGEIDIRSLVKDRGKRKVGEEDESARTKKR
jgi:hypothetical protein